MKKQIFIIGLTLFLCINTYYDNYYTNRLKSFKKYWTMITIAFTGLSLFLLIRYKPNESSSLFQSFASIVSFMPLDKSIKKTYIEPLLINEQNKNVYQPKPRQHVQQPPQNKRSVSETKKKYIASKQGWRCSKCNQVLDATYEVDHIIPLYKGGSNEVSNLEALCRNCHGQKTLMDKL